MNINHRDVAHGQSASTNLTAQQNRNILIAGLTCAAFSVLAALVTLRWFLLMKRTFRHKLIMFLILSDSLKSLWYFVFPIVVFTRGTVQSSSSFCQASGFLLSTGIEASDFAIFMIAIHSIVYIFRPPASSNESGGLYPWRHYIYPAWVGLPILAAALAFVNDDNAYATAGTYCYLPRRPFWYRLALSWIPRYFVLILIFLMYASLYIYVTLKFRSFGNLMRSDSESSTRSDSRRSSMSADDIAPDELPPPPPPVDTPKKNRFSRPGFSRSGSYNTDTSPRQLDPWDEVSFITTRGLRNSGTETQGIQSADFANAPDANFSAFSFGASDAPDTPQSRISGCPTTNTGRTSATLIATPAPRLSKPPKSVDPMDRTRRAIRKQLRYLFIYPAVYVFMWIFPFVAHCLLYEDYYVSNPIYWLTIVSTCSVSLQAAADCIVFSWREKPWRRIPEERRWTISHLSVITSGKSSARPSATEVEQPGRPHASAASSSNWWEAEGKKRKDSVWMGTDRRDTVLEPTMSRITEADANEIDHENPGSRSGRA